MHICYGYGIKANTDWKKTLGSEWRQYEEAFPKLQTSNIDIISLECHNSRVPIDLLELIRGKKSWWVQLMLQRTRLKHRKKLPIHYVKRFSL